MKIYIAEMEDEEEMSKAREFRDISLYNEKRSSFFAHIQKSTFQDNLETTIFCLLFATAYSKYLFIMD